MMYHAFWEVCSLLRRFYGHPFPIKEDLRIGCSQNGTGLNYFERLAGNLWILKPSRSVFMVNVLLHALT